MNAPHAAAVSNAAALAAALEQALAQQQAPPPRATQRVDVAAASAGNGLAKLVLALMKLLHELLERQALRRIEAGSLNDDEIERLGLALMRQAEEIERLAGQFGFTDADLNLDLGPLGRLF
ncbi:MULTISPECIES: gas vesicle protein K [Burkholderia]|uniref:Gas vesicle protein GvpK n=1 Tax=Burkholderia savannae TaxID=1637837 RepID=A0ABR5T7S6_9BURK|nr:MULTISPECIES: gas vesicle protein K [Burkholderia]AOJ71133.1 gas vesicle protein GvpK [Burkholderia savannae]AOJ85104.1 gas vesicle protein GvpK [Burkholderia savannae]AOK51075.1 gas vesicle protein GvpK [Burkholderia sp. MSMB617WGS]KGS08488.1 gas vesicle K family protein [Burkholderia sp. ABCPW 111]KVG48799.1 gas vesicle protein GvpK [Burkholderia sp. MSMB0265]